MFVRVLATVAVVLVSSTAFAQSRPLPANWNFLNADGQAGWLCLNRNDDEACAEAARIINSRRKPTPTARVEPYPENWNGMDAQEQAWWMCRDDPDRVTARCKNVTKEGERTVPATAAYAPQPAYQEYVRFMVDRKEVRTGKVTVFTYAQWVQYCRGEFAGQVKRVGRGRGDRTCLNFVNPPTTTYVTANQAPTPYAPTPAHTYTPPSEARRCGRRCGELWTEADFEESRREIERLEREIASAAPLYRPYPSTSTQMGGTTFYNSNRGVTGTTTTLPPFQFHHFSNGTSGTTTHIDPFAFHSFQDRRGNTTNGTTTTLGQFQFHNFDNGVNGTSTTIGGTTFHNFSNGKNCTTTTIGTTQFTNCY